MPAMHQNIRARRAELGLSQGELAKRLGYTSRSTIAKIEAGENDIPRAKIQAFADALETTPARLMGWEESTAPAFAPQSETIESIIHLVGNLPEEEQRKWYLRLKAQIEAEREILKG